jgi:hypothetical protein
MEENPSIQRSDFRRQVIGGGTKPALAPDKRNEAPVPLRIMIAISVDNMRLEVFIPKMRRERDERGTIVQADV